MKCSEEEPCEECIKLGAKPTVSKSKLNDGLCAACGHALKHHTPYGCEGAFPNGTEGVSPDEVFYGECHCTVRPKKETGV